MPVCFKNSQAIPIQGDNPKIIQLGEEDDEENEAALQTHKKNNAEERQNENKEEVTSNDSNLEQTSKNTASLVKTMKNRQGPKRVAASSSALHPYAVLKKKIKSMHNIGKEYYRKKSPIKKQPKRERHRSAPIESI